jgi:hypothetical protein
LLGKVDGIEIVDIAPKGLEDNIECYIRMAASLILRQKLAIPLCPDLRPPGRCLSSTDVAFATNPP